MSFFNKGNKNSNSKNSNNDINSSSQNPGGGLPVDQQSSSQTSVLNGNPNMTLLDAMDRQLVAVEEGQFRAVQAEFAQKEITQKAAKLLSTQALFNKYIQDPNVGKVDINGVEKTMDQLQDDINNQRRILIEAVDTIQSIRAEDDEFRQKREALNRLVIKSQNRIPVEDAAAYITYIFERMSKKRDFDPVITKRICDGIVQKFEEEMGKQGKVGLIQQYSDWIKSYIDDVLNKAIIAYLRAKALVEPTGRAAAGLTMIGLAATNLAPQLEYVSSVSQSFGPALMRDESLVMTGVGNVVRTLSTATTNTLIAATNFVTSAIASHPVAATFGGLSLLLSAYWQLSSDHRGQVSELMKELLEKLQFIWNQATDPNKWIPAYHRVISLMTEIKEFLEDRGILVVDEEYDSVLSVRSASSSSSSSASSSGVAPLRIPSNSTVSSLTRETILSRASTKASTKATTDADSVSLELFKTTGQQLAEEKLKRFQALLNTESASSSSSSSSVSGVPREVDFTRARSDISSLTATPFGSQDLDSSSPYSRDYSRGGPSGIFKPVLQDSRANSPHSQDSLIANSPGFTPPGSPLVGQKRTTSEPDLLESNKKGRPTSDSTSSSQSSDMYKGLGGRRKSRRHGTRTSTKKRQYRKYRNTRKRSRRHTKKRSRK